VKVPFRMGTFRRGCGGRWRMCYRRRRRRRQGRQRVCGTGQQAGACLHSEQKRKHSSVRARNVPPPQRASVRARVVGAAAAASADAASSLRATPPHTSGARAEKNAASNTHTHTCARLGGLSDAQNARAQRKNARRARALRLSRRAEGAWMCHDQVARRLMGPRRRLMDRGYAFGCAALG
jgi:hypothetical protein